MSRHRGVRRDYLLLVGADNPNAPLAWALVRGATGQVLRQGMVDEQTRGGIAAAPRTRTILLIPATEAQLKRVELPARTEAQARAAAAYLFEAGFAAPGPMHFAVGSAQDESGARLVAAISPARLKEWLDRCRIHGCDPSVVALDCTIFEVGVGEAVLIDTPDRTILAAGRVGGLSLEPGLARSLIGRFLATAVKPVLAIKYCGPDIAGARAWFDPAIDVRPAPTADPMALMAAAVVEATEIAPNLRQGDFAPNMGKAGQTGRWRVVVALAALALMVNAAAQAASGWREAQAASLIEARAVQQFSALQPGLPPGADLRARVTALSNAAKRVGAHPILQINTPLTRSLAAHPSVRLDLMSHQNAEASVQVRLSSANPQDIAAVVDHLRAQGLVVEIGQEQGGLSRTSQALTVEPAP
ncbi:MAG: type II secretion system protein GspL [Caulobacterales bacterium]